MTDQQRPHESRQPVRPRSASTTRPEAAVEDDRDTIMADAGHIPDRDQMFRRDPASRAPPSDDWSGDAEEDVKGDRDSNADAVGELRRAQRATGAAIGSRAPSDNPAKLGPDPTAAPAADPGMGLDALSDDELRERATALGVAGAAELSRMRLITGIKEALTSTLH